MTLRMRGLDLPDWGTKTGSATNKVWSEFLRREHRRDRVRIDFEMMSMYALAGSPDGDPEKRFEVMEPSRKALLAHMDQSVHRTAYKRDLLMAKVRNLQEREAEMERIDWISSEGFSLTDWASGK